LETFGILENWWLRRGVAFEKWSQLEVQLYFLKPLFNLTYGKITFLESDNDPNISESLLVLVQ